MFEISHLTKTYGDRKAVDDISFTLEPGHIYGLLGPNGAGKSTTMNMMTGCLGSAAGTIEVDDLDILKDANEAKAKIGYLPEIPPLYPDMTVSEYLRFVIELKKVPKKGARKEYKRLVEAADLSEVEDRLIRNLSKGYRQRVGLAGAMANDPEYLILDEPTVGLDPRQLAEFRELLFKLKKDHAILISSHILAEISEVCDHIFIISKGKLILSADQDQIGSLVDDTKRILHIRGIGDGDGARMALLDLSEIARVTVQQTAGEGECLLTVEITGGKDVRPQISQILVENGFTITEMKEEAQSLEDLFLKLTGKEAAKK